MLKWVNQGLVEIIGPIRQEILSGIRGPSKFDVVKDRLRAFPDLEIGTDDNEEAAVRSEEHTSELQSPCNLACRLLLAKKQYTAASHSSTCLIRALLLASSAMARS